MSVSRISRTDELQEPASHFLEVIDMASIRTIQALGVSFSLFFFTLVESMTANLL